MHWAFAGVSEAVPGVRPRRLLLCGALIGSIGPAPGGSAGTTAAVPVGHRDRQPAKPRPEAFAEALPLAAAFAALPRPRPRPPPRPRQRADPAPAPLPAAGPSSAASGTAASPSGASGAAAADSSLSRAPSAAATPPSAAPSSSDSEKSPPDTAGGCTSRSVTWQKSPVSAMWCRQTLSRQCRTALASLPVGPQALLTLQRQPNGSARP